MSVILSPEPSRPLWRRAGFFAFVLLIFILMLLLSIVHLQHHIRLLETHYAEKMVDLKHLKEEWGRLSLEKNHLSAPARVEQIAAQKLSMTIDKKSKSDHTQVIFIKPIPEQKNDRSSDSNETSPITNSEHLP